MAPRLWMGSATGAIGQSCAVVVRERKLWLDDGDGGSPSRDAWGADGSAGWDGFGGGSTSSRGAGARKEGTLGGGIGRFGSDSAGDDGNRAEWSLASSESPGGVLRCFTAARPGRLIGAGGALGGTDAGRGKSGRDAGRGTPRAPSPGCVFTIRSPDFGASES